MDIQTPLHNKNNRMPYFNRYQTMSRQVEIRNSWDRLLISFIYLDFFFVAFLIFHHFICLQGNISRQDLEESRRLTRDSESSEQDCVDLEIQRDSENVINMAGNVPGKCFNVKQSYSASSFWSIYFFALFSILRWNRGHSRAWTVWWFPNYWLAERSCQR